MEQLDRLRVLENEMRHDLQISQFELYYQPQYHLQTKKIIGFEALLRWKHPMYGMISPVEFIPLAEQTKQIHKLTGWVVRSACLQIVRQNQTNKVPIAVNISASSFNNECIVKLIKAVLSETNADPTYLQLELTESIAALNLEQVIEQLVELRALGIKIAIDDFGTGYSSLSNLAALPIDILKIDKSFIRNSTNLKFAKVGEILELIVKMAKHLKLTVIAEGVETQEEVDFLCNIDCNEIQGCFFSKPLPEKAAWEMLQHHNTVRQS